MSKASRRCCRPIAEARHRRRALRADKGRDGARPFYEALFSDLVRQSRRMPAAALQGPISWSTTRSGAAGACSGGLRPSRAAATAVEFEGCSHGRAHRRRGMPVVENAWLDLAAIMQPAPQDSASGPPSDEAGRPNQRRRTRKRLAAGRRTAYAGGVAAPALEEIAARRRASSRIPPVAISSIEALHREASLEDCGVQAAVVVGDTCCRTRRSGWNASMRR